jgi:hypothetical protein
MQARAPSAASAAVVVAALVWAACVDPPPKIAAIPESGLKVRLFVFGASAQDAQQAFNAAKQNNKSFAVVHEGGDGEILVGLENDSPKCVPPTGLCSYKVAVRIRDNQNKVVHQFTTTGSANAERCADLCEKALNQVVVKVIEGAASALKNGQPEEAPPAEPVEADSGPPPATSNKPVKKAAAKGAKEAKEPPPPPKAEPAICVAAQGPHLPSEEAERRTAQVEVLKRIGILDHEEYDCLRKAYLSRL